MSEMTPAPSGSLEGCQYNDEIRRLYPGLEDRSTTFLRRDVENAFEASSANEVGAMEAIFERIVRAVGDDLLVRLIRIRHELRMALRARSDPGLRSVQQRALQELHSQPGSALLRGMYANTCSLLDGDRDAAATWIDFHQRQQGSSYSHASCSRALLLAAKAAWAAGDPSGGSWFARASVEHVRLALPMPVVDLDYAIQMAKSLADAPFYLNDQSHREHEHFIATGEPFLDNTIDWLESAAGHAWSAELTACLDLGRRLPEDTEVARWHGALSARYDAYASLLTRYREIYRAGQQARYPDPGPSAAPWTVPAARPSHWPALVVAAALSGVLLIAALRHWSSAASPSAPGSVDGRPTGVSGGLPVGTSPPLRPAGAVLRPSSISASSWFARGREHHLPSAAFDGDLSTAWNDGVDGSGVGQWIEARFVGAHRFVRARVSTGFDYVSRHHGDLFYANAHLRRLTVLVDGHEVRTIDVANDQRDVVVANLNVVGSSIQFVATAVYPGTLWQDVCISEIVIEGSAP